MVRIIGFILGLENACKESQEITANKIAKEVEASINGRYETKFNGILNSLKINSILSNTQEEVEKKIDEDFLNFINSNEWTTLDSGKIN